MHGSCWRSQAANGRTTSGRRPHVRGFDRVALRAHAAMYCVARATNVTAAFIATSRATEEQPLGGGAGRPWRKRPPSRARRVRAGNCPDARAARHEAKDLKRSSRREVHAREQLIAGGSFPAPELFATNRPVGPLRLDSVRSGPTAQVRISTTSFPASRDWRSYSW